MRRGLSKTCVFKQKETACLAVRSCPAEREGLLVLPDTKDELIRHYTFSDSDLSIIRQRRGNAPDQPGASLGLV